MAAPFPSQAWADQYQQILNASDTYQSAAQRWEGDVLLVIEGDGALYLDLWHGACREATYLTDSQGKRADYIITATMDNWRKVLAGEIEPVQGMMTRQLRLDGNLMKLMQYLKAAQELVKCAAQVGIEG
ncbi:MAG: SCP2 sterol-binding domain-containing protein [Caldilineaceae bacterium]